MKPADVDLVEQVRTLLHEYLTEDEDGSIASRNPITSVNEILRNGKTGRDNLKVRALFQRSFCFANDLVSLYTSFPIPTRESQLRP